MVSGGLGPTKAANGGPDHPLTKSWGPQPHYPAALVEITYHLHQ
jgi:hypothetical protein